MPNEDGNQQYHYWPFATSDLYNWHSKKTPFSKDPHDLTNLLKATLFTQQHTLDDCEQLLKVLFITKERNRMITEACKVVPELTGEPTADSAHIDAVLPTVQSEWDHNSVEGKKRLKVYCQTLLVALKEVARQIINMSKVYE